MPTVLVDARNVARSRWPNLSDGELVERCAKWATVRDLDMLLVFDGRLRRERSESDSEHRVKSPHVRVIETDGESADDRIAAEATSLRAAGVPHWLVTSDRELRERAGIRAERVIGGGTFLRELRELDA